MRTKEGKGERGGKGKERQRKKGKWRGKRRKNCKRGGEKLKMEGGKE